MSTLMSFAEFGTVDDASATTNSVTISSDFTNADDHYNGLRLYVLSGAGSPRRATIADQTGLTLTLSSGDELTVPPDDGANIAIMS